MLRRNKPTSHQQINARQCGDPPKKKVPLGAPDRKGHGCVARPKKKVKTSPKKPSGPPDQPRGDERAAGALPVADGHGEGVVEAPKLSDPVDETLREGTVAQEEQQPVATPPPVVKEELTYETFKRDYPAVLEAFKDYFENGGRKTGIRGCT